LLPSFEDLSFYSSDDQALFLADPSSPAFVLVSAHLPIDCALWMYFIRGGDGSVALIFWYFCEVRLESTDGTSCPHYFSDWPKQLRLLLLRYSLNRLLYFVKVGRRQCSQVMLLPFASDLIVVQAPSLSQALPHIVAIFSFPYMIPIFGVPASFFSSPLTHPFFSRNPLNASIRVLHILLVLPVFLYFADSPQLSHRFWLILYLQFSFFSALRSFLLHI